MNMKLLKRFAVMASSGIGLIGVVLMLIELFGANCFAALNKLAFAGGKVRVIGLIFALLIVCAIAAVHLFVFLSALKGEKAQKARLVTLEGDKKDVVLIHQETLDSLVKGIIGQPEGVTDIAIDTGYQDMKLNVKIDLAVDIDTDIRETTERMRKDVRHQIEDVNGIAMSGVSILISKINVPEISDGMSMPWAGKTEETVEATPSSDAEEVADAEETLETEEILEAHADEGEKTEFVMDDEPFEPAPFTEEKTEE